MLPHNSRQRWENDGLIALLRSSHLPSTTTFLRFYQLPIVDRSPKRSHKATAQWTKFLWKLPLRLCFTTLPRIWAHLSNSVLNFKIFAVTVSMLRWIGWALPDQLMAWTKLFLVCGERCSLHFVIGLRLRFLDSTYTTDDAPHCAYPSLLLLTKLLGQRWGWIVELCRLPPWRVRSSPHRKTCS